MPGSEPTAAVVRPALRFRFQTKLIAMLVLMVVATQLATLAIIQVATERSLRTQLTRDLAVGGNVWSQFYATRANDLLQSVAVLADDFGFKRAVASGDPSTLQLVLANQASRIDAEIALLLQPDGQLAASLVSTPAAEQTQAMAPLLQAAQRDGHAAGTVVVDGRPFQLVLVPVMAPQPIAWVAVGLPLDTAYAQNFQRLTGLDASFVSTDTSRPDAPLRVHASSLVPKLWPRLAALRAAALPPLAQVRPIALGQDEYFAAAIPLADRAQGLQVLLQASVARAMEPYAALRYNVLWLSALATAIALVSALLLGRNVSHPLNALARAARRIQRGDYSRTVTVRGRDELAQLASTFSHMQRDIAQRERQILHQSRYDALTGLPNRTMAVEALVAAIARAHDDGSCCAVMLLDLDRLREFNDTLGRAFGDRMLAEVARRLRAGVPAEVSLFRLGGDDFMALMEQAQPEHVLENAADLLMLLREPMAEADSRINLDASLGIALCPQHGDDAETLLRRAESAVHDGRHAGQRVALYQSGRDEKHLRQLGLMSDLGAALARNEFFLRYQPKIRLRDRRLTHVEALLRWTHPQLGPVGPDEFVPLAERSGAIHSLTGFVLNQSLAQVARWREQGIEVGMAVNLSALDLADQDLPDLIRTSLARYRVPAEDLILELTEGALMRDVDQAVRLLDDLRHSGLRFSIDDFGTGYSSLAQLKRMPVYELKIDKSFVMQMSEDSDDATIVRSTIELGHSMGMSVTAEGVETLASLALLDRYGCDTAQGYLFSPPIAGDALPEWLARQGGPWLASAAR